eukprot:g3775.t1
MGNGCCSCCCCCGAKKAPGPDLTSIVPAAGRKADSQEDRRREFKTAGLKHIFRQYDLDGDNAMSASEVAILMIEISAAVRGGTFDDEKSVAMQEFFQAEAEALVAQLSPETRLLSEEMIVGWVMRGQIEGTESVAGADSKEIDERKEGSDVSEEAGMKSGGFLRFEKFRKGLLEIGVNGPNANPSRSNFRRNGKYFKEKKVKKKKKAKAGASESTAGMPYAVSDDAASQREFSEHNVGTNCSKEAQDAAKQAWDGF